MSAATAVAPRRARSSSRIHVVSPPLVRVEGYRTGDFIGIVVERDAYCGGMRIQVVDPLRPVPLDLCPFPTCSLGVDHDGDHEPGEVIRAGSLVSVWSHNCHLVICGGANA